MDFVNKAYAQLTDLFKSMTPGSRITAGLLLTMIVVSFVYLFLFQSNTANKFLYDGRQFSLSELSKIEDAFAASKLSEYEIVGDRVRIPGGQQTAYLQALQKSDFVPIDFDSPVQDALNNSRSFLESSEVTKNRLLQAEQRKLALAIEAMPQIERAAVQYKQYKSSGFPPETQRKATVVASGKGHTAILPSTINAIRDTAAGWFGIDPTDVTVTDLNGQCSYSPDVDGPGRDSKVYAETKFMYEQQYQNKIYDCLSVYPRVVVGVNVELDPDVMNESMKITVDPQPVPIESQSSSKTVESGPATGGRPGAVPNEVAGNVAREVATVASQKSSMDETSEQQTSTTGHEQVNRKRAALTLKTVTATISLPKSYFRQVWALDPKNKPKEGEEPKDPPAAELLTIEKEITEQIKNKVVHVLPQMDVGESPFPQVEVSSYEDIPLPVREPPSMASSALAWFSRNWQTFGLFAVGLFSLLVLRSMIRATTPTVESATPSATPQIAQEEEGEEPEEPPAILHRRAAPTGASLREELTAMVHEDPDAAANVLRTWIGEAA